MMFAPGERIRCACGQEMPGEVWTEHRKGTEAVCKGCAILNYDEARYIAWLKNQQTVK